MGWRTFMYKGPQLWIRIVIWKKPFPFVPVRFCHFCFFFVFTVCPETEETLYTDQFFESQDIVVNALDNVEARRYMDRSESLHRLSLWQSIPETITSPSSSHRSTNCRKRLIEFPLGMNQFRRTVYNFMGCRGIRHPSKLNTVQRVAGQFRPCFTYVPVASLSIRPGAFLKVF